MGMLEHIFRIILIATGRKSCVHKHLLSYRVHNNTRKLHHVSLGLVYLHSHNIVHGDLKLVHELIIRVLPHLSINIL
jgi:hypothetical protein